MSQFMQRKSRALYNWWLGKLKSGEKWNFVQAKRSLKASREHDPELNDVYGMLLAEVYFRLDRAMQAFFRRVKKGEKPGFPRFRPRHKFFSLVYPGRYIKLKGNKVILPTGGKGKNKKY
ncbi:MAG: RNA-guided endonuclease TnpB family protein, partial [Cyanobacteria bacterium J06639_18]